MGFEAAKCLIFEEVCLSLSTSDIEDVTNIKMDRSHLMRNTHTTMLIKRPVLDNRYLMNYYVLSKLSFIPYSGNIVKYSRQICRAPATN